jgi:uncharacterized membrane protein YraQ (UPF0718 family)
MNCAFGKINKVAATPLPPGACCSAPRALSPSPTSRRLFLLTAAAALAGIVVYTLLDPISRFVVLEIARFTPESAAGGALQFFIFETPKVLLLLTSIVFVMAIVRSYFSPSATRAILAGRRGRLAHVSAALLGTVTPFCSCSAVPLFIGFLTAGVPLGVTFSFLIAAPMVNEIALGLLFSLFGWKLAALYLGTGLAIAIVAGWLIGALRMERHVEPWVFDEAPQPAHDRARLDWAARIRAGWEGVREIVGRVWIHVLAGIAVGAAIHGFVPQDFMASIMGRDVWWSVPLAVIIGVPMYSNAAAIVPVVQALLAKGAALGTALAFMMSVIALSLPEMIILRRVLRVPLILTFIAVVATGILLVGYLFNFLLVR